MLCASVVGPLPQVLRCKKLRHIRRGGKRRGLILEQPIRSEPVVKVTTYPAGTITELPPTRLEPLVPDTSEQDHYTSCAIQPIEFIVANTMDFLEGNIVKYVARYKNKNGLEDLAKARHYLDMLIEREEAAAP